MAAPTSARGGLLRYGIDAPYVPMILGGVAVVAAVIGAAAPGSAWLFAVAGLFLIQVGFYLYATLIGKHRAWQRLLNRLELQGDEQVLDLGCGRGAVLIATATRLSTGTAHGLDLWRSNDQSGNDQTVTEANAEAAGVADRVELHTGDMRELPFPDASFDVVTSSLAIHNLRGEDARDQVLDEVLRVLRPGGDLVIADIRAVRAYATHLRAKGNVEGVRSRGLGPGVWFAGPWQATSVVSAAKVGS